MSAIHSLLALTAATSLGFAAPRISLPVTFEENVGQAQAPVRYFGSAPGVGIWLLDSGAVMTLAHGNRQAVLHMRFKGARPHPPMDASAQMAGYSNYFTGNDPARWRTHVALFERVRYHDVYPGVDMEFHGNAQTLEYDWVLAPGADPHAIRMSFSGADSVKISPSGDLLLESGGLEIRHQKPRVYQSGREIAGRSLSAVAKLDSRWKPTTTANR